MSSLEKSRWRLAIGALILSSLQPAALLSQSIVISEFMAKNDTFLEDQDGEFPDWLELHNVSGAAIDLEGWHLTDDPNNLTRWTFPEGAQIPARGYLTVFCSGKDIIDPAEPLHTSFKLKSAGEYCALVRPDGATIEWQFSPRFREQVGDVSYGYPQEFTETTVLQTGATARYLVPQDDSLGLDWTAPDFDDSGWDQGATGIGFDQKSRPTYDDFIETDIGDAMRRVNSTAYLRIPFDLAAGADFDLLQLRLRFEDGFVAYLNGTEVASANAPSDPDWDSRSSGRQSTSDAIELRTLDISSHQDLLRAGRNVLAIHGMNDSSSSSDFFVQPEVVGVDLGELDTLNPRYFDEPTPGGPGREGFPAIASRPRFTPRGGAFAENVEVTLEAPAPGSQFRVTVDGSTPTEASDLYQGPIAINSTTVVRARTFTPGLLPSVTEEQSYVILNPNVLDFSSNLPLVVLNTFGRNIGQNIFTPGHVLVIDVNPETGRTRLTDTPDYAGNMGIKVRGSSTSGRPKPSYSLELQDEEGEDFDASLLGMPAESDWVLWGPYNFDPALIRNPFAYDLSNQIGVYATRHRFIEVYRNQTRGPVSDAHYFGVYALIEKIKRGPDRVDVEELPASATEEPEITGGYMLKIDRPDPGDQGFSAAGQTLRYVYPKEVEIERRPAQVVWLRNYFNEFFATLNSPNFDDPENGYAKFIDVDLWIDHHLLNVLTMNVDALRLSTYMYKPRSGKLTMGPIWDFDRSMQSTDGRDDNPRTWRGGGDATDYFNYPWWRRLFDDPKFQARYERRWRELRRGKFSTANIHATIDGMADELREAQARNFQRWSISRRGGWQGEINLMKSWLQTRAEWIDSQFTPRPILDPPPGDYQDQGGPLQLTLSQDGDEGDIVYTLDGSDPRGSGGRPSDNALIWDGTPIEITENTLVRARVQLSRTLWSGLSEGGYILDIAPIAPTEIMFNPLGGVDFEFLELMNFGDEPVRLRGMRMARGVVFDFDAQTPEFLEPGGRIVLVRDLPAFQSRYSLPDSLVAGEYRGSFSDRGETLVMEGPVGETIFDARYRDEWYPTETDGGGHSLVLVDPHTPPESWDDNPDAWRPSFEVNGSPGAVDVEVLPGGQIPGDGNQDGRFNISDAIHLLRYLFSGEVTALPCGDGSATEAPNLLLLNSNGDFAIDASDAVYNLRYLFLDGPPPIMGRDCTPIEDCPHVCTPQ